MSATDQADGPSTSRPQQPRRHNPPRLQSGRSQVHSFVRFVNQTLRKVDIVWLNYEGARVRYKTLQPDQFVDVNTFVGHPWIFRDADTGDKLMVQLQEVFEPIGYNINEGWPPQRRVVRISIPVYSLQQRCLQILRDMVPPSRVESLDIPLTLKQEIQELVASKSSYNNNNSKSHQNST
ncbi:von Hippel-Lindau disease tumor suppressor-like [Littorina saxatilis]|uniref:von Hippel-Lindau disease tumour suppressor beta domain-containing protein n=1 Tax=Littorina saxatilis TaxID=31220 RepID=A0AAN9AY05_9CAEN